ncbi:hypothetical protein HYH02_000124 [Chlamydomonas schloesseri]|uniref:Photolyase/cryptochrome alpha/beta domain-containing protein n=1 Tax=Chlamydomonas schloesseri TaxID=2026947 RepID=A0A836B7R6_9CHLO|nr:hypothetical protein HYH02_000124 [Chlamydomonas schloesseri]|eukprot:KAG2450020.1 hypothetical protein HYH02_000124 [Chlamydomonas schloesseri]
MPYEFKTAVVWFRRDLRVDDNPALVAALAAAPNVIPVFIWAPEEEGQFQPGRCSRWWTKHSLVDLQQALAALGSRLVIRRSTDSTAALLQLVNELGAEAVFFNHLYDPISLMRDHDCKRGLAAAGVAHRTFNGDMLYEPWDVLDANKQPYSTFDDFWNSVRAMPVPPPFPVSAPASMPAVPASVPSMAITEVDWFFTAEQEASSDQLKFKWKPGVGGAIAELEHFLGERLSDFEHDRAKVDRDSTSRLSPWIHIGSISVRYIFYRVRQCQAEWLAGGADRGRSCDDFLQQMGYREYSRYLAFHFPFIHERSLLRHLRACPWRIDQHAFKAWRQGQTGYPIVDAAMRQLWSSGWCHNRGRVVAASFLVKDLLLPWQWGLKHYWDAQIDADLECDALGWQYVSGGMTDAHPFSYMMDLETEARRFDPDGEYVRRWLPALSRLPTEYIHAPWKAPPSVLAAADVELGCNYPLPIISRGDAKANVDYACGVLEKSAVAPTGSESSGRYPYRAPTYPKAGGASGGAAGAGSSGGNPTAGMGGASGGAGPSSGTGTGGQGGVFRGAADGGGSAPVSQQGGVLAPGVAVCVTAGTGGGAQPDSRTVSGANAGVSNSAGGVACDMPPPSHSRPRGGAGGSNGVAAPGVGGVSGGPASAGGASRKAPAPGAAVFYHPGEASGEGHALLERILQQQRRQRGVAAGRQDGSGTNQPPPPLAAAPGMLDAAAATAAAAAAAAAGGGGVGLAALPGLLQGLHGGAGATAAAAVAWASRVAAGGVDDLDALGLWSQQQQLLQGSNAAFAFEQAMELLLARRRAGDGVSGFRGGDAPGRGGAGADGDGLLLEEEDSEEVVSNTVDLNLTAFTGASCHRQSGTARGARAAERRYAKAAAAAAPGGSPARTDAGGSAGAGCGEEEDAMQCGDEDQAQDPHYGGRGTPPRREADAAEHEEGGEGEGDGSDGAAEDGDEGGYDNCSDDDDDSEGHGDVTPEEEEDAVEDGMMVDGGGGGAACGAGAAAGQHKRRRSQSEGELADVAWE